jgi:peptide chain release factor subunit 1
VITEKELQALVSFDGRGSNVLSVYLDTDSARHTKEESRLTLRQILSAVSDLAASRDVQRVQRFFDTEYDWQGKGAAIFSCQKQKFWQVHRLAVPVESGAFIASKPHIKPLSDLLDEYERYGVALVDREGARLFLIQMGEIEEATTLFSEVPGRHKQGGRSQSRYQRHIDEHALQNLKHAAEITTAFCQAQKCHRLILAGTEDNVTQFREMLPHPLREQVIGSVALDMTTSPAEVFERSMALVREVENRREAELVETMITAAAKGQSGAIGLADTLAALQEGRAMTLIVAKRLQARGQVCTQCSYLMPAESTKCLACGSPTRAVDDVVDLAVQKAVALGTKIETVEHNEALEQAGGIGAILRY